MEEVESSVGAGEYATDDETESVAEASDVATAAEVDSVDDDAEVAVAETVDGPLVVAGAAVKTASVAEVGKPTTRGVVAGEEELVADTEDERLSEA